MPVGLGKSRYKRTTAPKYQTASILLQPRWQSLRRSQVVETAWWLLLQRGYSLLPAGTTVMV